LKAGSRRQGWKIRLILNTPLVASNNLLAVPQKLITEPGASGVGGEVKLIAAGPVYNLDISL
jgi:hypothetical protein